MGLIPSPVSILNVKGFVFDALTLLVGDSLATNGIRWPDNVPRPGTPYVKATIRNIRRASRRPDNRERRDFPVSWDAQLLDVADGSSRGLNINGFWYDQTPVTAGTVEAERDALLVLIQAGIAAGDINVTAAAVSTDTIRISEVTPGSAWLVKPRPSTSWTVTESLTTTYVKFVTGFREVAVSLNFYSDDIKAQTGALDLAMRFETGLTESEAVVDLRADRKVSVLSVRQVNNLPELATQENHGRAQVDIVLSVSMLFIDQAVEFDLTGDDWFSYNFAS